MKKMTGFVCAVVLAAGTVAASAQDAKLTERLTNASAVISEIMSTPDKGIPQSILAGASCVVVVPKYKKAAFVVGGQYGQGVATCRTPAWMERACVCAACRRKLWFSNRRAVD